MHIVELMSSSGHPIAYNRTRTRLIWLLWSLGLIGIGVLVVMTLRSPSRIEGLQLMGRQLRGHDNQLLYLESDLPPVGGPHPELWLTCGVYREVVPAGYAIHSLEHGTVWITYRPDLSTADIALLEQFAWGQSYLILSPYPQQAHPVILTAWGVQLALDSPHDDRLERFIHRYQLGPTTPERGASCQDGFGDPIDR